MLYKGSSLQLAESLLARFLRWKSERTAWRVRRKSGGCEKKGANEGLATSAETSCESRKADREGEKRRSRGVLVERRRETMERRVAGSAAGDDRGKRREKRRHRRILIETSVRLIKNHCRLRSRGEIALELAFGDWRVRSSLYRQMRLHPFRR